MEEENDNQKFIKLIASGQINFEMTLILTDQEAELFNVHPNKIHKISDCASFLSHQGNNFFITSNQTKPKKLNIFDNIRLNSNNRNINTLLFINRAFKKKIFIEYVTMNQIKLSEENMFMKEVLKHVTEQNFLFLVENKFISNLDSHIKFSIKINNKIVASFDNICDNSHSDSLESENTQNINIIKENSGEEKSKILEKAEDNKIDENYHKETNKENEKKELSHHEDNASKFSKRIKDIKTEEVVSKGDRDLLKDEQVSIIDVKNSNLKEKSDENDKIKISSKNENSLGQDQDQSSIKEKSNKIDLEIAPSPVKNKIDKSQNEEDITANKIIRDIHSDQNKTRKDDDLILENKDEISDPNSDSLNDIKSTQNIYERFRYDFSGCNYFLIDLDEIISLKENNFSLFDFKELLLRINQDFPEIILITHFPNILKNIKLLDNNSLKILSDIIKDSDIHIFEKKESIYLFNTLAKINGTSPSEENKNLEMIYLKEFKRKRGISPKLGIFFDGMRKVTIIQQDQSLNSVVFNTDYSFNLIPPNISSVVQNEYDRIFSNKIDLLRAVFLGGMFSRMFYKKSFNTCFTAGNEIMKRVIELIRFNSDSPADINYFLIRIKKESKGKSEEEKVLQMKENKFVLDSTNVVRSKMKDYNPLLDNNLSSFFSSKINRSYLCKKGFINRNGGIVDDPEKRKIAIVETKNIMQIYENEKNHLQKIKDQKEKMRLQIRSLLNTNMKNIKSGYLKDLEKLSKIYTFNPMTKNKLPLIDMKTTSMKSTNFKNSVYLRELSKGNKPKSLFNMNTFVSVDTKREKSTSPLPKTNSNQITSNRYMSKSTNKVLSPAKEKQYSPKVTLSIKKDENNEKNNNSERIKSGSIKQSANHTKSRAESRYTVNRSITEGALNKDINMSLNGELRNSRIEDPIKIENNVSIEKNELNESRISEKENQISNKESVVKEKEEKNEEQLEKEKELNKDEIVEKEYNISESEEKKEDSKSENENQKSRIEMEIISEKEEIINKSILDDQPKNESTSKIKENEDKENVEQEKSINDEEPDNKELSISEGLKTQEIANQKNEKQE